MLFRSIHALARGVADGRIGRGTAIGIATVMFSAGGESTAALIGSMVRRLAEDPETTRVLRERPEFIPNFVEEVARLEPPFHFHYRLVKRDCELGGLARVATLFDRLRRAGAFLTTLGGGFLSPSALGTARGEGEPLRGRQVVDVLDESGLGVAQLCDAKADITRSFRDDDEIALFRTGDELRAKAEWLLGSEPSRRRLGERARARALAEHTWAHRLAELAGQPVPGDRPIDGRTLTAVLHGTGEREATPFFYLSLRTPFFGEQRHQVGAVRVGQWKLKLPQRGYPQFHLGNIGAVLMIVIVFSHRRFIAERTSNVYSGTPPRRLSICSRSWDFICVALPLFYRFFWV